MTPLQSRDDVPHLARLLLHPVWLGSLALLALNDHWLKGSGLLPGALTGKLSDFAGLMVAPLLLAVLVGVRRRSTWLLTHVAVGIVFAAIQLWGWAADGWSQLMGLVGQPWLITKDPTDLIALPMLVLSAHCYPKWAAARARDLARRSAELAAAAGGLACCVATSPPPGDPIIPGFDADVYIHNDNDFEIVVRVRPVRPEVDLDCGAIETDPGRLLTEPMFAPATSWTLLPDANMLLAEEQLWGDRPFAECHAYRLDAENLEPLIVFWRPGDLGWTWVEGTGVTGDNYISIAYDSEGRASYDTMLEQVHEAPREIPEPAPACAPTDDAARLASSGPAPSGTWVLQAAREGVDGCVQLDLGSSLEDLPQREWTLCLPTGSFPFAAGDAITITASGDAVGFAEGGELRIDAVDPDTGLALDGGASLVVVTGGGARPVWDAVATASSNFECNLEVEPACGTVFRAAKITVAGGDFGALELVPGGEATVASDEQGRRVEIHLPVAAERVAMNPDCVQGPTTLGYDVELVAVKRAL